MKSTYLYIILLFSLAACNKKDAEKPTWLNVSAVVQLPAASLQFTSSHRNWKARLQSFIQPIPLRLQYHDSGFVIHLQNKQGIVEGPAQIIIENGQHYYYYDVFLVNEQTATTKKDYRSPKTVNPDSSLLQQRILHVINVNRNLLVRNNHYFTEEEITLAPKAGTFRAIDSEPLSAYYVQAGSCAGITLKSTYNKEKELFTVTTGTLKDNYNNIVADGTLVAFLFSDDKQTYRMEAALRDGVATVYIPSARKKYILIATVNQTVSNTLILKP